MLSYSSFDVAGEIAANHHVVFLNSARLDIIAACALTTVPLLAAATRSML